MPKSICNDIQSQCRRAKIETLSELFEAIPVLFGLVILTFVFKS